MPPPGTCQENYHHDQFPVSMLLALLPQENCAAFYSVSLGDPYTGPELLALTLIKLLQEYSIHCHHDRTFLGGCEL